MEIHENVRGEDVFVVQSTSYPANDNLMELLVTLDALKRGSAAGLPLFCLLWLCPSGQKVGPRTPILQASGEFDYHRRGRQSSDD